MKNQSSNVIRMVLLAVVVGWLLGFYFWSQVGELPRRYLLVGGFMGLIGVASLAYAVFKKH